jgi:L-rhamnose mutarotase
MVGCSGSRRSILPDPGIEAWGIPKAAQSRTQRSNMPRHCLTLDLQNDPAKIAEYKRYHEKIWPEIRDSLFAAGVTNMEIYLQGTRMFMIMDVSDDFSFEKKAAMDAANPKVMEWEALMGNFQAVPDGANPVRRWAVMDQVFDLSKQ